MSRHACVRRRGSLLAVACAAALLAPTGASAAYSVGTPEQVSWVRRAAANFVAAELAGNGAGACAILDARLRGVQHRRTCAQRWNTKLAKLRHEHGWRSRVRAQQRAIPAAAVVVHGDRASIDLPTSLMAGRSDFRWTENCWMLEG
jgi:hypothetical protein